VCERPPDIQLYADAGYVVQRLQLELQTATRVAAGYVVQRLRLALQTATRVAAGYVVQRLRLQLALADCNSSGLQMDM
jgi:hypothetical protein